MCKYFKADAFFFPAHFQLEPDVCLFSVLFYVIASGITLHLTFCEQLTHTVWCCTKALCIIFVLLFCHLPLLSGDPVTIRDDFLLRGSLISSTSKVKPGRKHDARKHPSQNAVTICSLAKEKSKTKQKQRTGSGVPGATPGRPLCSVCENMRAVSYSCHHIISKRLVPYENFLSNFCILI